MGRQVLLSFRRSQVDKPNGYLTPVCNHLQPGFSAAAAADANEHTQPQQRTVRLAVKASPTGQVTAVLNVELDPQPFVVDARLHFYHAENEFMCVHPISYFKAKG
eukprot:SAG31_NODE_2697_length_5227_cov_1.318643_5_plen_105_part_00